LFSAVVAFRDWQHPASVLALYAIIAVIDGFVLQPFIMRRIAKVPIWASILAPIVLGIVWPFWGVLVAAPLLAVVYAYKARMEKSNQSRQ
jgi:predicted PurR-regulated permease PerM